MFIPSSNCGASRRRASGPTEPSVAWTGKYDTDAGHYAATSNVLTQWTDQSGNGRHLTPNSGGPVDNALTTPNGEIAISWTSGSHEYLQSAVALSNFVTSTAWTEFLVARANTIDTAYRMLVSDANEVQALFVRDQGFNPKVNITNDGGASYPGSSLSAATWAVIEARLDSGTIYVRVNGSGEQSLAVSPTANLTGALTLFADPFSVPDAAISFCGVTNTALDLTTRDAVNAWLMSKYGIA